MQMSRYIRSTSKNTTELSLYFSPHPITFSPSAAVAVAARMVCLIYLPITTRSLLQPNFSPAKTLNNGSVPDDKRPLIIVAARQKLYS